jgi:N-acetylmuramoyl-L-alanine amidase
MRQITLIAIHCSASPNGKIVSAETIDSWHKARGFRRNPVTARSARPYLPHIGYHYVIGLGGTVDLGRGEDEPGAHIAGNNAKSIGICLVGTDKFTAAQWAALAALVRALMARYEHADVMGHRDTSPDKDGDGVVEKHEWLKICPGFDVYTWLKSGMQPLAGHLLSS